MALPSSYRLVEEAHCHAAGFQLAETLSGGRVAVKEIALAHMQCQKDFPLHLRAISREADTLKNMSWASPVVIRLVDCWLLNDFAKACLVTEWLPLNLTSVLQKIKSEQAVSVDKHKARRWFAHAVTGIAAIHAAGFVHCDVQPSNLWLTEDMQRCKVAGLGISKPLKRRGVIGRSGSGTRSSLDDDTSSILSAVSDTESVVSGLSLLATLRGTNGYSSPEMIMERRITEATDVFSLGCVLLEMLTLTPLGEMSLGACEESSPEEAAWSLVADARVRCFEVENIDLQSLAANCADLPGICVSMLNLDPGQRPTASDIVARSQKLQAFLPELVRESSKLRAIILRESRRVHFNPSWLCGDMNELRSDECCDSGSELTPAVA
jgi:serine/threonine protein kinase